MLAAYQQYPLHNECKGAGHNLSALGLVATSDNHPQLAEAGV